MTDLLLEHIRNTERAKLLDEGYIHKSKCPAAREAEKIRQLKKANKSLQRKINELNMELTAIKLMRWNYEWNYEY